MKLLGKATKEVTVIYKTAVICDKCGRANQYGIQEDKVENINCGNTECERVFTDKELQALIDETTS